MAGDKTYRDLEARYGYSAPTIFRWVKEAERVGKEKRLTREDLLGVRVEGEDAAAEIRRLKAELEKAELHNKLLNAMIDIAEEDMGVDIRKKRGPGR